MSEPLHPPSYPPPAFPPPGFPPPGFPPPGFPPPGFPPPGSPPPRRRSVVPIVLAVVAAVLVLAVAIVVPVVLTRNDDAPAGGDAGAGASEPDTSSLAAVKEYDGLTNQHVAPGEEPDYPQSPPVGGDHAPYWLECGAYDQPVPEANAVHDLEHGTVWLTYRPDDLDAAGIRRLTEVLPANGILSPYDDQAAPVVITVWGRQLELAGPDDPRIALFIAQFGAGDTAPEPFASCNGGVHPADLPPVGGPVV